MQSEKKILNDLKTEILNLKDGFTKEDLDYLGVDKIYWKQNLLWANYDDDVRKQLAKISVYVGILGYDNKQFWKLFDEVTV